MESPDCTARSHRLPTCENHDDSDIDPHSTKVTSTRNTEDVASESESAITACQLQFGETSNATTENLSTSVPPKHEENGSSRGKESAGVACKLHGTLKPKPSLPPQNAL